MKKLITVFLAINFSIAAWAQTSTPRFEVEFWQDGEKVEIEDGNVKLEKHEFQIRVALLNKLRGVSVSADFSPEGYYSTPDYMSFSDAINWELRSIMETDFNPSYELVLSHKSIGYYYYNDRRSKITHSFDKVEKKESRCVGTRTVRQLYSYDEGKALSWSELEEPVYLFFISRYWDDEANQVKDGNRMKLKIVWI